MTEQELVERLSDQEHASWAHWMIYLFDKCKDMPDGSLVIPPPFVARWQRQIDTPYSHLTEQEKQSDRAEVAHILPIIKEYCRNAATNAKPEQEGQH